MHVRMSSQKGLKCTVANSEILEEGASNNAAAVQSYHW